MMSIGNVSITLSRFENGGVRVTAYKNLEHMLEELLMNSGDKIPYLVRDEILPKAIKAWDEAKHKEEHPSGSVLIWAIIYLTNPPSEAHNA